MSRWRIGAVTHTLVGRAKVVTWGEGKAELAGDEIVAIYKSEDDGKVYVCRESDFYKRFEEIRGRATGAQGEKL